MRLAWFDKPVPSAVHFFNRFGKLTTGKLGTNGIEGLATGASRTPACACEASVN
jgi:hypothetical protein